MKYFFYATDQFNQDIKNCSFNKNFDEIKIEMERDLKAGKYPEEDGKHKNTFPSKMDGVKYLKYRTQTANGKYRGLFARKYLSINDERCVCCVAARFFIRKDPLYDKDFQNDEKRDKIAFSQDVDWSFYELKIQDEMSKNNTVSFQELSPAERELLNTDRRIGAFQTIVYESKEFVKDVLAGKLKDCLVAIGNAVGDVERQNGGLVWRDFSSEGLKEETLGGKIGGTILFYYCNIDGTSNFALLEYVKNAEDLETRKNVWKCKLDREKVKYGGKTIKAIRAISGRAYSADLLLSIDAWQEAELEKNSNYILSGEESKIIRETETMPMFVKGRAGSGKSTVIQYLFCEYLLKYLELRKQDGKLKPPAYLSYNGKLVDAAKGMFKNLFKNNSEYRDRLKNLDFDSDIIPVFDKTCLVFQEMEKSFLGASGNYFVRNKHVSFSDFERLWKEKFKYDQNVLNKCDAALCWYIIRSFIKGWNSQSYLTPDEYSKIGSSNKTVTQKVYEFVYNKIWEGWYKPFLKAENRWDDQDLVRFCLENDLMKESFSAVFCDEAQDFTRVEIDLILKTSSFVQRRYENREFENKIPFVFAGDEFQTLNPTGFSWNSVRSHLSEKLREYKVFQSDRGVGDPISLNLNFRSTSSIVNLGNRLQLLQETRCGETISEPQEANSVDADQVYCVPPSKLVFDKLSDLNAILIVPTSDGEKMETFLQNSGQKIPSELCQQALTPMEAKGLEFEYVALFGFSCPELSVKNLTEWFDEKDHLNNLEQNINLRYKLSNAYVAATRAKKKLFIIDSDAENSIWSFACLSNDSEQRRKVDTLQEKMLSKINNKEKRERWKNSLGWIALGDIGQINVESISSIKNAEEFERGGLDLQSSDLMRKAALAYRMANECAKAQWCEAKADYFDQNYLNAADAFVEARYLDEAALSYWSAYATTSEKSVEDTVERLGKIGCSEKTLSDFCIVWNDKNLTLNKIVAFLSNLKKAFEAETNRKLCEYPRDIAWNRALVELLEKYETSSKIQNDLYPNGTRFLIECVKELEDNIGILDKSVISKIAFSKKDYQQVISIWENDKQRPKEYYEAVVQTKSYPDKIKAIKYPGNTDWFNQVVSLYRENKDVSLVNDSKAIVGEAVFICGTENEKIKFLPLMLSICKTKQDADKMLSAVSLSDKSQKALHLLLSVKLKDFSEQIERIDKKDKFLFVPYLVFKSVSEIQNGELKKDLENKNVNIREYFNTHFRINIKNAINDIFLTECGKVMESMKDSQNGCVNALRFYEWAQDKCSAGFRAEIVRRHSFMQLQKDLRSATDEDKRDAISQDIKKYPVEFKYGEWERVIAEYVSGDVKSEAVSDEKSSTVSNDRSTGLDNEKEQTDNVEQENLLEKIKDIDYPDIEGWRILRKNNGKTLRMNNKNGDQCTLSADGEIEIDDGILHTKIGDGECRLDKEDIILKNRNGIAEINFSKIGVRLCFNIKK